jgi:hypothetical protein
MVRLKRFLTYAFIFSAITFSTYFLIEFTFRDTLAALSFAQSGVSITNVIFGFASTILISIIIGVVITFYIYKNEDRILSRLRVQ